MRLSQDALAFFSGSAHTNDINSLEPELFPKHLAVIMDGNGRWAKARGLSRSEGHKAGIEGLKELVEACVKLKIPYLTVFAFSTENWSRPKIEVNTLMKLFAKEIEKQMPLLQNNRVRLNFIGDISTLPEAVQNSFAKGVKDTQDFENLTLSLAVNYGSRQEIVRAAQSLAQEYAQGSLELDQIDEQHFGDKLYTKGLPEIDLVIRTSGEYRLSNFLLWQIAYAEFYITDTLWPDFTRYDLVKATLSYQKRERRFGAIGS